MLAFDPRIYMRCIIRCIQFFLRGKVLEILVSQIKFQILVMLFLLIPLLVMLFLLIPSELVFNR
jgi:hypothetical protein